MIFISQMNIILLFRSSNMAAMNTLYMLGERQARHLDSRQPGPCPIQAQTDTKP